MMQSSCNTLFMSFLVLAFPLLSSCVEETDKVALPESSYAFTSTSQSASDVHTRMSCGFSRQAETEGQYFVDGRAFELEGATDPAVVILHFPGTQQLAPAPGTYTIPGEVSLRLVINQRATGLLSSKEVRKRQNRSRATGRSPMSVFAVAARWVSFPVGGSRRRRFRFACPIEGQ
ncbi:MAG: hypothetical protein RBU37_22665 [Myxococcota bacterium]|jgi:hypothetical protein|nr:hypothetical protein [Myxococcota bacterium]